MAQRPAHFHNLLFAVRPHRLLSLQLHPIVELEALRREIDLFQIIKLLQMKRVPETECPGDAQCEGAPDR